MKQYLPGIVRIAYLSCANLPSNIEMRALVGLPTGIYDLKNEVCFTGSPTCVTENVYDNHAQMEKTTLTFASLMTFQ